MFGSENNYLLFNHSPTFGVTVIRKHPPAYYGLLRHIEIPLRLYYNS